MIAETYEPGDVEFGKAGETRDLARTSLDDAVDQANERLLQEWIGRIADQDQQAFAALYETMIGKVYGLALRITRRVQLAEEVAEDTFWQIWRQIPRFKWNGVRRWLGS